ncbi:MAG: DNA replication and repair protein RecF [Candidatus Methylacidiphilales bacterium]|nr:DNA replication and repair protein RecF [Candidatus Methylacidiphilales bacterium]
MLTSLHLADFRCHADVHYRELGPRVAFVGENGKGKTTLLEAVHFLARVRSFRTHQNRELIAWGKTACGVSGRFTGEPDEWLKVTWSPDERTLTAGGEALNFRHYWGRCLVTVFQNTDRQLVQGAAQVRRQWVDSLISTFDPVYLEAVQASHLLLRQKNALLRQERPDRGTWEALTAQLRRHTEGIARARAAFTVQAAPLLGRFYSDLAGGREVLVLRHADEITRQLARTDAELWERETALRLARLGPHRDDWEMDLDGQPLRQFGSEGQQKSAVLALRDVEVALVRERRGRWPILLVDDAVNELDAGRQELFWQRLPKDAQILLATTRTDRLPLGMDFAVVPL